MNSSQFERWLRKQGMEIYNRKGTGHKEVRCPETGRKTMLPTHGGKQQLKKGLIEAVKKDLGLK
ncbi:MAG: addiction module toxin, HicA family [Alphaproteobacteria bacterium]|nr:addiction module toxin, HicA family [Alphaproteobacteria bacterium]